MDTDMNIDTFGPTAYTSYARIQQAAVGGNSF